MHKLSPKKGSLLDRVIGVKGFDEIIIDIEEALPSFDEGRVNKSSDLLQLPSETTRGEVAIEFLVFSGIDHWPRAGVEAMSEIGNGNRPPWFEIIYGNPGPIKDPDDLGYWRSLFRRANKKSPPVGCPPGPGLISFLAEGDQSRPRLVKADGFHFSNSLKVSMASLR
jgi:hypothetical protein